MNDILIKNRECKTCPPHFVRIKTQSGHFLRTLAALEPDCQNNVRNWCYTHIHHRFFVGIYTDILATNNAIVEYEVAAFEDASDATYFSLMLPSIN